MLYEMTAQSALCEVTLTANVLAVTRHAFTCLCKVCHALGPGWKHRLFIKSSNVKMSWMKINSLFMSHRDRRVVLVSIILNMQRALLWNKLSEEAKFGKDQAE